MKFDLVVIGAGPGGYVAAIRGAQLGMKTAVIEKEHLGGVCLNFGCIPTKALLKAADIYKTIKNSEEFGISCKDVSFDIKKIVERSRNVAQKLSKGIEFLLQKNNVTLFKGHATLSGNSKIDVKNSSENISAKNIIIATGARARKLDGLCEGIWYYKEAMLPSKLPESILIIGSGAIGMEFASLYNEFGSNVTVLEVCDTILRTEDEEISRMARKEFESRGIKIITGAKLESLTKEGDKFSAKISCIKEKVTFENVICAVGVQPNIENIGIENTKIEILDGYIKTNDNFETREKGVYAIGDVTSPPWLAHKASHEGIACVDGISGLSVHKLDKNMIPACIYSNPQIASVGISENEAKKLGLKVKVGKFPFSASGKAIAMGDDFGIIKMIFDANTGEILGAHMIGNGVTELIHSVTVAKSLESTEKELMNSIFPHPTLSESIHEATLAAFNRAIHI
ncbi:Dihydrolipoyl dehydrogenase [Candidatus Cyrtobacter comes]|uniref:Dihydrolipoyl dehydrogenase n=1 Tax=Candidatus Cyrtobacter comes TaxID=675776 RepID=A0ABU5L7E8_9RICK|nr:dihydrolipoyl dehydrogenase [Candidatus Cyrtobacter comes]MDZ5762049.1 Dihydrolipoyl dehydrogenase [Candidatus Cyrtobacter comes]